VNKIRQEQRFFATELQKVDKNSKKLITVDTMNRLNKEATNLYDAEEEDQKEELKKEKKKVKAVAAGGGGVVSGGDVELRRSGREVKKRNILDL
jgi:poly-gamma-glutamate capsule biosynthesis protein CapA/YwtB (metallophosphatase superfamily)